MGEKYRPAKHIATLDGLRGVAAIAVLSLHILQTLKYSPELLPHAHLAVDFFFLLSGFVIARAYEDRLASSLTLRRFFVIRVIRLYPLVLAGVLLGAASLFIHALMKGDYSLSGVLMAVLSGLVLAPTTVLTPRNPLLFPVDPPAWSLFFELVINVVYAVCLPLLKTRRLLIVCLLCLAALGWTALENHGLDIGFTPETFWYGFIRVSFPFLMGVLLYRWPARLQLSELSTLLVAVLLVCVLLFPLWKDSWLFEFAAVAICFPVLVLLGAACRNRRRVDGICLWLGQLSYPLYIIHNPLLRVTDNFFKIMRIELPPLAAAGVCVVLAITISFGFLKLWDEPVRARLSSWAKPR